MQFNYQSPITREEFASLVVSVLNFETRHRVDLILARPETKFKDTDSEDVIKAYNFGVVNGVSDTAFMPEKLITRQEAAVMMFNLLKTIQVGGLSKESVPYVDRLSISDWALDAVNVTSNLKIFEGSEMGFRPSDPYTREQAMVVMRRLLQVHSVSDMVSLRGRVAFHLEDLGTEEEAKARKLSPVSATTEINSVKLLWTEKNRSVESYLRMFEGEVGHHHPYSTGFTQETINKLKSHSRTVVEGDFTISIGDGNQKDGYLLEISWDRNE